jgi:hypothetical protein
MVRRRSCDSPRNGPATARPCLLLSGALVKFVEAARLWIAEAPDVRVRVYDHGRTAVSNRAVNPLLIRPGSCARGARVMSTDDHDQDDYPCEEP